MYVCFLLASRLVQHKSCFCENHVNFEAVRMVWDLARKQHSRELAQPAARIASVTRSRSAVPPFLQIRGLITDVIATLEARVKVGEDDRDRDGDLTDRPGFDQVCKVQGRNIHNHLQGLHRDR